MVNDKNNSNYRLEDFFDNIMDIFYDGIYISDASGKTLKINKMYEKLTGLAKEELLGKHVLELKRNGIFDICLNPTIVKTGKPQTAIQVNKFNRKLVLNGHPVFDKSGKVAYVVTYVRDITVLSELKEQVHFQSKLIEKYHQEAHYLRQEGLKNESMVLESPKMKEMMELLKKVAGTDTTVLILGETGVGKDVFAREIHKRSPRRDGVFFKVNCATIPESLIESELFGYAPGAFSGASTKGKPGFFEMADNGTLFLDEIGELPLVMQAKLLRVLQDQEIMRVGSTKVKKVDVRFIAATNRNLEEAVKEGTFRSDLYYRLRVAVLELPPLRERKEEIIPFVNYFLHKFNTKYKKKLSLSEGACEFLQNYRWPGNVREMENLILSLVVTQDKEFIDKNDLPGYLRAGNDEGNDLIPGKVEYSGKHTLKEIMDEFEKKLLENALEKYQSISKVAKALNVDRSTVFRKLKKYGII